MCPENSLTEILKKIPQPEWRPPNTLVAYCDESSWTAHRYFVIGALYFSPTNSAETTQVIQKLEHKLGEIKVHFNIRNQLKWERAPSAGQYQEGYKACLAFVLKLLKDHKWFFKCIVVDTLKYPLDGKEYMDGDPITGYFKFYCVFLSRGLMRGLASYFHDIRVDKCSRGFGRDVETLEYTVNQKFKNRDTSIKQDKNYINYCKIQECEPREHNLLQVADLLTGAVAHAWNKKDKPSSKRRLAKKTLLSLIQEELRRDLSEKTPNCERRFGIWQFVASNRKDVGDVN